ncbi:MAG: ABC transporter permease [Rhodospirillaceae bacterium]|jgi:tungstate transport system permease protein|nr:ABC transporter permease [Rhodospirillaceae bacterium]MBT5940527.1 ABC transporter permease [Rhodospirillaceae bacterium]MBT7268808.1 ABC transporter permease [Rhodospirillaceae bacterium]
MSDFSDAFAAALTLIINFESGLAEIVGLSLQVSFVAVLAASVIGLPLGAALAVFRFPGRVTLVVLLNALMGLPPVVVGLIVYLILSRSGPLGTLGLLFTPTAMIIAQTILIMPIIAALTRQSTATMWDEYSEQFKSFGTSRSETVLTLLWDNRFGLMTTILAGFGRASAEVGAVMIVGGNIDHVTRVMTTTIALETSKGDLALALGLGIILLCLALSVNAAAYLINESALKRHG